MTREEALKELGKTFTEGVIKWLSHVTDSSAASDKYYELMLNVSMTSEKALEELGKTYTEGVIKSIRSNLSRINESNEAHGMELANCDDTIIANCSNCNVQQRSTHTYFDDRDNTNNIAIPSCRICKKNMKEMSASTLPTLNLARIKAIEVSITVHVYHCES